MVLRWDGDYRAHAHLSVRNLGNALLCATALVPSLGGAAVLYGRSEMHPVAAANLLFLANVTVGFWVVGLLQRSFWLIDPYWTLLPPLIGHFYQLHPAATAGDSARARIALGLTWVWAVRLTHSYFRREEWKFGQREDWRYTKMARENPRLWPMLSFFAVGLAQQPMLCGVTLPLYSVHFRSLAGPGPAGLTPLDLVAAALCLFGICYACVADNALRGYMLENERRAEAGQPKLAILNTGLWRYSRHPNYFGEQVWWWGLGLFGVSVGDWWVLAGTLFNSLVLSQVTSMTEERMLTSWEPKRAALYKEYCKVTSMWIPLPPSRPPTSSSKAE